MNMLASGGQSRVWCGLWECFLKVEVQKRSEPMASALDDGAALQDYDFEEDNTKLHV